MDDMEQPNVRLVSTEFSQQQTDVKSKRVFRCPYVVRNGIGGAKPCDYSSDRVGNYKRHAQYLHLKPLVNKRCCGMEFFSKADYNFHHVSVHMVQGRTSFSCQHCDYRTIRKKALDLHVEIHHLPEDKRSYIHCEFTGCNYRTLHRFNLKRHLKTRHDIDVPEHGSKRRIRHGSSTSTASEASGELGASVFMEPIYNCIYCTFQSQSYETVKHHSEQNHKEDLVGDKPFCFMAMKPQVDGLGVQPRKLAPKPVSYFKANREIVTKALQDSQILPDFDEAGSTHSSSCIEGSLEGTSSFTNDPSASEILGCSIAYAFDSVPVDPSEMTQNEVDSKAVTCGHGPVETTRTDETYDLTELMSFPAWDLQYSDPDPTQTLLALETAQSHSLTPAVATETVCQTTDMFLAGTMYEGPYDPEEVQQPPEGVKKEEPVFDSGSASAQNDEQQGEFEFRMKN